MTTATFLTLLCLGVVWVVYAIAGKGQTNKVLERIIIFGLFLTPFIPLVVTPSLFFPFITGKNFLFRIVVEIITASWLILAIRSPQYRPKKSSVFWAFVALAATMLISVLLGADPFRSFWSNFERMEGYITLIHLFAFFLVTASVFFREHIWDRLLKVTLAVSVYIFFYGVLQLLGFLTINQGGVRLDGTFGNATYLAVYCIFAIFFSALLAVREHAKKISSTVMWSSIGVISLALIIFLLYAYKYCGSFRSCRGRLKYPHYRERDCRRQFGEEIFRRCGYTRLSHFLISSFCITPRRAEPSSVLSAALILMAIIILFAQKGSKAIRMTAMWFLIVVAVGFGGFLGLKNTSFVQGSPVLSRFASINLSDSETTARFYIWDMAWKGFLEKPVFGWGQENFNLVFNKFYAPQLYSQEQWFDRTHDIFFDWLVTGGLFGFAAYFFLFGAALWLVWKNAKISLPRKLCSPDFSAPISSIIFSSSTTLPVYFLRSMLGYISEHRRRPFIKMGNEDTAVSEKTTLTSRRRLSLSLFFSALSISSIIRAMRPVARS